MKKIIFLAIVSLSIGLTAQVKQDSITSDPQKQVNAAQRILTSNLNQKGLTIGGYAEAHYNNASGKNAILDVHRVVILLGYKFNERTQFITELEFEHVNEIAVEQSFFTVFL